MGPLRRLCESGFAIGDALTRWQSNDVLILSEFMMFRFAKNWAGQDSNL